MYFYGVFIKGNRYFPIYNTWSLHMNALIILGWFCLYLSNHPRYYVTTWNRSHLKGVVSFLRALILHCFESCFLYLRSNSRSLLEMSCFSLGQFPDLIYTKPAQPFLILSSRGIRTACMHLCSAFIPVQFYIQGLFFSLHICFANLPESQTFFYRHNSSSAFINLSCFHFPPCSWG